MPSTAAARIKPPSMFLALAEMQRAAFEYATLPLAAPLLSFAPRGDGHPVLVLPGFITDDLWTAPLRRYLESLGYDTHAWELGRNLGPRSIGANGEKLAERLRTIHEATGQKVSLVGWSLGGVMARELASHFPEQVRQVITLGSPFTGDPRATTVAPVYERVTGEKLSGPAMEQRLREASAPLAVPATSIYSKSDGIVAWRNCIDAGEERSENIEVYGSHCGLGANPAALFAVADRLAQPDGEWTPFDRSGCRAAFYPAPPSAH
ncbi:alpha/beta fold hydrolase [Phenylobacterium sp.]|uniref:alpha/beta fold hydrolase n=1 Tax=Phenylobacterium sp. TaxID=1871053 RepID=UPI002F95900E